MRVKIVETGKIKTLAIIDPKSKCNWIKDLVGNSNGFGQNTEDKFVQVDEGDHDFVTSQENYDWWYELIINMNKADEAEEDTRKKIEEAYMDDEETLREKIEKFDREICDACDTDLEYQPSARIQVCEDFEI